MHQQGLSERAIAQHLQVSRQLVHHCVSAPAFPERAPSSRRPRKRDPYPPSLRQRWEHGCRHGLQLAREITAQGFGGSASLV
ncbi:MAG TPA: ISL3 family transposase, partial [Ktedonobacteraceae bacterium]